MLERKGLLFSDGVCGHQLHSVAGFPRLPLLTQVKVTILSQCKAHWPDRIQHKLLLIAISFKNQISHLFPLVRIFLLKMNFTLSIFWNSSMIFEILCYQKTAFETTSVHQKNSTVFEILRRKE